MESNTGEDERINKQDFSVKHFVKEALHDVTHFDVKFIKTFKPLLFKPGYLTLKAFSAEQEQYVKPLALFIFLNFVFFIFKVKGIFQYHLEGYQTEAFFRSYIIHAFSETSLSPVIFAERFNTAMRFEEKEYLIIMVPLLALLVQLLYGFKKNYIEHLVFALHFYSFFLVFLTLSPILFYAVDLIFGLLDLDKTILSSETATLLTVVPVWFIYLLFAMRKVYKQNWALTFFKSLMATLEVLALIAFVYRVVLFFIVLHSVNE